MAVVVPAPHAPLAEQSLIEWTNARVGKQQRIRGVVFRADLPRNANGKVLKRELHHEPAHLH